MQDKDPDERSNAIRNMGMGVMIPGMLFGCVLIGCVLGYYADKWIGHGYWFFAVGLILGSVAGVREMLKLLKKMGAGK